MAQAPLHQGPAFPQADGILPAQMVSHPAYLTSVGAAPVGPVLQEEEGDGRGVGVFIASLLGSYAGWLGGAYGGAVLLDNADFGLYEAEFIIGVLAGSAVGGSLGAALGGNLADGPPGTFGERLLVAGLVGLGGTALAVAADSPELWIGVPLMQTIAMVTRDYR